MNKKSSKPEVPRPIQFRKATTRKAFARKVGCDLCLIHFILELAAREVIYIREEERGQIPRAHLRQLLKAKNTIEQAKDETPHWYKYDEKLHVDLPDGLPYFYQTFNIAIHFSNYRDARIQGFSDAAAKCFKFLDWEDQVKIMESVLAVSNEFGFPQKLDEICVCNDWLEERGMEPMLIADLFGGIS